MTRIRILHVELEGAASEMAQLVRETLRVTAQSTSVAVLEVEPSAGALSTMSQAVEPGLRLSPPVEAAPPSREDEPPSAIAARPKKERKARPTKEKQAGRARGAGVPQSAASAPSSMKSGKRGQHSAEIERRLGKGEKVSAIAASLGVPAATVYGVRARMKRVAGGKASAAATEGAPVYRCQHCGQRGTDPKRCDNVNCHMPRKL